MKYDPEKHHRRSIRLKRYDYSQPGCYFLTMCTRNGESIFGEISDNGMKLNEFGEIVQSYWNKIPQRYPKTESVAFVVMPNHVHGIVCIIWDPDARDNIVRAVSKPPVGAVHDAKRRSQTPLRVRRNMLIPKLVGWFKMNTAKRINQMRNTRGFSVWQRNYWEHVIRIEKSMNRIFEYIQTNPFRWHLDRNNPTREGEDDFDKWIASL
ncbi:transposase [candidate division WOR-3 bacterium]|nr:transposase [candidate division WOR-3 bacterium]